MAGYQPAWNGDFAALTPHDHIFGQLGPPVQIIGTAAALEELRKGAIVDGLIVRADQPANASDAVEQSLVFLRLKKAFPTSAQLLKFASQPAELQLVGGIAPEDWLTSKTVQNTVYPPFHLQTLNIDFLVTFLRVAQIYHNEGRIYQLVILSQTNYGQCHVDLLPTVKDSKHTHSIFLYRHFVWVGHEVGVVESWRGFSLRPGAKQPDVEVIQTPIYPPSLVARVIRLRQKQDALRGYMSGTTSQQGRVSSVDALNTNPNTPAFRKSSIDQYAHFSNEEILSGAVSPKHIQGDLILRLAEGYSNSDLAQRCNSLRNKQAKKDLTVNGYIKRISNALRAVHPTDQAYDEARTAFDAVRRENGVLVSTARLAQINGTGETPGKKRKRSMTSVPQSMADVAHLGLEGQKISKLDHAKELTGSMRKLRARTLTPKPQVGYQDEDDEEMDEGGLETDDEADDFRNESVEEEDDDNFDEGDEL